MKKYSLLLLCMLISIASMAQYSVSSPNKKTQVKLNTMTRVEINTRSLIPYRMNLDLTSDGVSLIRKKEIGLEIMSHGKRYSFGKSPMRAYHVSPSPEYVKDTDDERFIMLGEKYSRLTLETETGIVLEMLVFNEAVAYRYTVKGYDRYKILDMCNVFPSDNDYAILGTFDGEMTLPWHIYSWNDTYKYDKQQDEWKNRYVSNRIVSWKDALSYCSFGVTFNSLTGDAWGEVSESSSLYADFAYKYVYAGVSFTPRYELLYVYDKYDFDPFINIGGGVKSWDISGRLGFNIPVEIGNNVWDITPYAAATYLNLGQKGNNPKYAKLTNKHHYLAGLGLKVQCMMRGRMSLGLGYEYQFFTGSKEPCGRRSLYFTIGHGF